MTHLLDNPVWHALNGRQAHLMQGGAIARRYQPDISPWAALASDSAAAVDGLADLVPQGGNVVVAMLTDKPLPSTPRMAAKTFEGVQMVAEKLQPILAADGVIDLGDADAAEMLELATLTKPGPFMARTHALGQFVGIRKEGRLIAMAGERFKLEGHTEVSGVCTHPDWRGRGYAGLLSRIVATRIMERGEVPMLHAFITNTAAIRLYTELGFVPRAMLQGAVYGHA